MGRRTDVAREAAGLVILDDALDSIVAAIRTGRRIYDNLRKVAMYLFAVHIPIAALALLPPLIGWPMLLGPVHVVLLKLVMDPTCSIVFELEPADADVMHRRPRGRSEHLFEARRIAFAVVLGIAAFAGPFMVVAACHIHGLSAEMIRTVGFVALIAADLALVVATASGWPRRGHEVARNPAILWMFAAVAVVVAAAICVPWSRTLFQFAAVDLHGVRPVKCERKP